MGPIFNNHHNDQQTINTDHKSKTLDQKCREAEPKIELMANKILEDAKEAKSSGSTHFEKSLDMFSDDYLETDLPFNLGMELVVNRLKKETDITVKGELILDSKAFPTPFVERSYLFKIDFLR